MKKIFLVICFVIFASTSIDAFAYDTCNGTNTDVPCTYEGHDFNFTWKGDYGAGGYINTDLTIFRNGANEVIAPEDLQDYTPYGISTLDSYGILIYSNPYFTGFVSSTSTGSLVPNQRYYIPIVTIPENDALIININPPEGGSVEADELPCTTCPCIYTLSEMDQSSIQATANTGYAFGYWKETTNPYSITPSGNKTMTAMFFKTFRNAMQNFTNPVENFRKNVNDTTGGQCVDYVKYETDITTASGQPFSGDAWTYYKQAINAGYQVGTIPLPGSIIVFDRVPGTTMSVGHVGIVISHNSTNDTVLIRESNWSTTETCTSNCETVGTHTETLGEHEILGYIYPTPQ